jgi:Ca-activated chloride channel family protein
MEGKLQARRTLHQAIGDFAKLVAKAFVGGLGAAVLMSLAILALVPSARAASPADAKAGALFFRGEGGAYEPAPQVSTEIAVEVTGMVARTRVIQRFHNPGSAFVEGLYVFPLPEKAAVDRLRMRIGERHIEGRIREKEEARRTYEKARAEGRKAALVVQQRPNLFTNAVAHIGPGEAIEIRIEYQQALAYDNGEYRLRIPLAVAPRYVPMGSAADVAAPQPSLRPAAYALPGAGPVNPVDIAVAIDAGVPLGAVQSSYHDTAIAKAEGTRAIVHLVRDQEEADRDFELAWRLAPGGAPRAAMFMQSRGDTDYALLMVVPPEAGAGERAAFQPLPRETVLVIDTSGSMQGASMDQARQALELALETLTERDLFNVVEFNSVTRPLERASIPVNTANLQRARAWVRKLRADGGTEMAGALSFALDNPPAPGYLKQVIFVTDGAVGNEDALFAIIARKLGAARLFTVAIGSAPNSHFMTKAAQFGRGTFTHIGDVREVRARMGALFERIESPVLRDVEVRWADGTPVETFPARVPDLYAGEPVLVAAAAKFPLGTVVVSGTRGNEPWSVALTPPHDRDAAGVGALWARSKIASLMDELARGADPAQVRPEVVKVALEHHLVSAFTSLVAVDVTPTAPAGEARSAAVKSALPHGWAEGTQLPQTDTAATLQLLMGLFALLAATGVALIGRRQALA